MVCMYRGPKMRRGTAVGHIEKSEFRRKAGGVVWLTSTFFHIQLWLSLLENIHIPSGNVYIKFQSSETNIALLVGRSDKEEGERTHHVLCSYSCTSESSKSDIWSIKQFGKDTLMMWGGIMRSEMYESARRGRMVGVTYQSPLEHYLCCKTVTKALNNWVAYGTPTLCLSPNMSVDGNTWLGGNQLINQSTGPKLLHLYLEDVL
jgi:hypothetical protein